jgi:hypothetical protein
MEFLNSLGISLLYLALLGIGLIYAVIILIAGAVHDLHIPGFEVHVGGHDFGPVGVDTLPDVHLGDVSHPSVKIPSLSPVTIASFITAFGAFGLISIGLFEVITPIPADSVGEVAFVAQGGRVTYTAKSLNGVTIARGTTVVIDKITGGVAVVHPQ